MKTPTKSKILTVVRKVVEAGKYSCPGLLDDFQLSEDYTVNISLSVRELRDLAEMDKPRLRKLIAASEMWAMSKYR